MGQQQQVLLSGGMFIVFVALAMGLRLYEENNDAMYLTQIEQELGYLAMKSQEYFHKPLHLNGGSGTFAGITSADDLTVIWEGRRVPRRVIMPTRSRSVSSLRRRTIR